MVKGKRRTGDAMLMAAIFAMMAMAYLSGVVGQAYSAQRAEILVAWEGERGPAWGGDDSFSFTELFHPGNPLWFLE